MLAVSKTLTFCFISGAHTDSSGQGKVMWARVKGRTENELMKLPFRAQYNLRPSGMMPFPNQQNDKAIYNFLVHIIRFFTPKNIVSLAELADAMIHATIHGYSKQVLEISDIKALAARK